MNHPNLLLLPEMPRRAHNPPDRACFTTISLNNPYTSNSIIPLLPFHHEFRRGMFEESLLIALNLSRSTDKFHCSFSCCLQWPPGSQWQAFVFVCVGLDYSTSRSQRADSTRSKSEPELRRIFTLQECPAALSSQNFG